MHYTAAEAARILGCSTASVLKFCNRGDVEGAEKLPPSTQKNRPKGEWRIPESAIETLRPRLRGPRSVSASRDRGAAGKVLRTLRILAESEPGCSGNPHSVTGCTSAHIAKRLSKDFTGPGPRARSVTLKSVRSYIQALQEEGFEISAKQNGSGEPVSYRLESSPFSLRTGLMDGNPRYAGYRSEAEMIPLPLAARRLIAQYPGRYKNYQTAQHTIRHYASRGQMPGAKKDGGRWYVPWPLPDWPEMGRARAQRGTGPAKMLLGALKLHTTSEAARVLMARDPGRFTNLRSARQTIKAGLSEGKIKNARKVGGLWGIPFPLPKDL